jgi:hypothetical protein
MIPNLEIWGPCKCGTCYGMGVTEKSRLLELHHNIWFPPLLFRMLNFIVEGGDSWECVKNMERLFCSACNRQISFRLATIIVFYIITICLNYIFLQYSLNLKCDVCLIGTKHSNLAYIDWGDHRSSFNTVNKVQRRFFDDGSESRISIPLYTRSRPSIIYIAHKELHMSWNNAS